MSKTQTKQRAREVKEQRIQILYTDHDVDQVSIIRLRKKSINVEYTYIINLSSMYLWGKSQPSSS